VTPCICDFPRLQSKVNFTKQLCKDDVHDQNDLLLQIYLYICSGKVTFLTFVNHNVELLVDYNNYELIYLHLNDLKFMRQLPNFSTLASNVQSNRILLALCFPSKV
jgi:hypothetical protein